MSFLFFIFFIGIFIAMCQDFRRREVDDWLNFLLFFSGSFFLVLSLKNFNLASYVFFLPF
jgi:Flp pilus assembly protein protease CpaA